MRLPRTARYQLSFITRFIAIVVLVAQLGTAPCVTCFGVAESTQTQKPGKKPIIPPDPTGGVKVNRTVPKVAPSTKPKFSESPKDEEFRTAHFFAEPLVPLGKTSQAENKALAVALTGFAKGADPEKTQGLTNFLSRFPQSAWRASLQANLGATYRSTGHWSQCLEAWEDAWKLVANQTEGPGKVLGDYVLGELANMHARLGHFERLEDLFKQIGDREVRGPATERVAGAKEGLALMKKRPQDAFRCGPMALQMILVSTKQSYGAPREIIESRSTQQGMSLVEVKGLADKIGLKYQMAKRAPGAKIILPALINWKVGHYAALTQERNGKYLSQDPTFTDNVWLSAQAIDQEGSGYYLVPEGELPPGWQPVNTDEAAKVWGKGATNSWTDPPPVCVAPSIGCPDCENHGMAGYSVDASRISLTITDTPLGYTPPKGPAVKFTVSYQQREVAPVTTPTYSNLGNKWSFNWTSYIVVDPNNSGADAKQYGPGGGTLGYSGFNSGTNTYSPQFDTHSSLVRNGAANYERRLPDGSKQIFALGDGSSVYPQKVFMTQSIDPQGNALTYTYDGTFRLVAVTDALGQVTTLSYELPGDPLKVTKVTDPFGRVATLQYNAANQLWKITDTVGMVSEVTYGTGDFINKLTTPYGDTTFSFGEEFRKRWLAITDPMGGKERIEFNGGGGETGIPWNDPQNTLPAGVPLVNLYLDARDTYYWDKKASAEASGDYTKARITHWLHSTDINVCSDVVESVKLPLENRVWNYYPNSNPGQVGSINEPSHVGRVLDDGTTQLYQYEYNNLGKTTKVTDPVGRITAYVYDTNNVDLVEVRQKTAGINELLASYTYNSQHLPLTATDAAGQTTIFTYTPAGQIHTIENPKHEVTTYNYDSNGYLQNIVGALPGAITSFDYDGFGRLRTTTDSEGYSVVIDYDAIGGNPAKTLDRVAKLTYPDGTYEQVTYDRLDPEWTRDRLGRWSRKFYDSLRHVVATQDPLNRFVLYDWCGCGSLTGLTDANGNTTSWIHDIQGRVTDKAYADQTSTHYTYENTTSRLKMVTDAQGQNTNYSYFIDNDLKQVSYTNAIHPTPTVNYAFDTNYNRLLSMNDGTGLTTYAYNPITAPPALGAGRLGSIDGPLDNDTIGYSYDELGRTTNRSINGAANAASVQYDSLGRVQNVTNPLGTFNYAYVNTTGRLDHVDFPNGQKTQYAYFDNLGDQRLEQIKNLDPSNSVISQFDYTYNRVGNILTWTQANSAAANPQRYDFGYDSADQLRSALLTDTVTGSAVNRSNYDYDPAGNRTNIQVGNVITSSSPNNLNQLTSQTSGGQMHFRGIVNEPSAVTVGGNLASVDGQGNFDGVADVNVGANTVVVVASDASGNARTNNYQVNVPSGVNNTLVYDLNGNLTSDGNKTYEWDAGNRLIAINIDSHRTELTYDGLSRRVAITEKDNGLTASSKNFVWISNSIAEERDGNNNIIKRFYPTGVQLTQPTTVNLFYTRDHLGSVRELIDSSQAVRARYDYDPHGARTKLSGNVDSDFGYTGHYYHAPSGLNLTLYRTYNPAMGRWFSRDPIGENGGLNLYAYVRNRPSGLVDPLGLVDRSGWRSSGGAIDSDYNGPLFIVNGDTGEVEIVPPFGKSSGNRWTKDWDFVLLPEGVWWHIGPGELDIGSDGRPKPWQFAHHKCPPNEEMDANDALLRFLFPWFFVFPFL